MFNYITAVWIWIALAFLTFAILLVGKIRVPYGRHATTGWGRMIDNRVGWFFMELPALILFPLLAIVGPAEKDWLTWLLVCLWSIHYINRTLIFPFRLRTKGKKMPLLIAGSALLFNGINGAVVGIYLGYLRAETDTYSVYDPHILCGLILFVAGVVINHQADNKLISLRKDGGGYKIPRGGLFNYISCPNHFGEMLEWIGFAVVAWNLPAASFAIWTFCNLMPRSLNHHHWYREQFADYPENRKAAIPFLW